MSEEVNPYAPPVSTDEPQPQPSGDGEPTLYYAASPLKVVLLTFATFGLYQVYWVYKQWQAVRIQTRESFSPSWRALFDIFFVNRLFPYIRGDVAAADVKVTMGTGALIAIFIVGEIVSRVTVRLETGWVWILGYVSVVPLAILQGEINQYLARRHPKLLRGSGFGAGAMALLVLGAICWALIAYGAFARPVDGGAP
jgi:hypothetical protein